MPDLHETDGDTARESTDSQPSCKASRHTLEQSHVQQKWHFYAKEAFLAKPECFDLTMNDSCIQIQ